MSAEPKEQKKEQEQEEPIYPIQDHEGFTQAAIKVRLHGTNYAPYNDIRPGWVLGDTGLGYYQHLTANVFYRPTHLKTGYALSWDFMTLENCQEYLKEVAPMLDWNSIDEAGPPKEIRPELIKIRNKYLPTHQQQVKEGR